MAVEKIKYNSSFVLYHINKDVCVPFSRLIRIASIYSMSGKSDIK